MLLLNHLDLRHSYDSDNDQILDDLIKPLLSASVSYLRSVGYLDSKMLAQLGNELEGMVRQDGEMKMLIGMTVSIEQYHAIRDGAKKPDTFLQFPDVDSLWQASRQESRERRGLLLISWLIAKRFLEIRFSIRPRGIHHEKFALFRDLSGDEVILHGTNNETEAANLTGANFESLSVFRSWDQEVFERYGIPKLEAFLRQWTNRTKSSITISAPNRILEEVIHFSERTSSSPEFSRLYDELLAKFEFDERLPDIPIFWGSNRYQLKEHQSKAINDWQDNDFSGLFKMATGSGKTITAIHAATRLGRQIVQDNLADFFVVVSVPYQILADQWVSNLQEYGYQPIRAYENKHRWVENFTRALDMSLNGPSGRMRAVVVVNRTLVDHDFQNLMRQISSDRLLFIADECHRVGKLIARSQLPEADYKIGLSATPWAKREEDLKINLLSYFGKIVSSYSLADAFNDEMLVPYRYLLLEVELSEEESASYARHAQEAKKLFALKSEGVDINESNLNFHLNEKNAVLGSCRQKFDKLYEALHWLDQKTNLKHLLVYCGSGSTEDDGDLAGLTRDIEKAQQRCRDLVGLEGARITYEERIKERNLIVDGFASGALHAIFAIRVLDEGFDMPSIRGAVLMASSRNERQFVQRRGRVLRKADGKSEAYIVDFLVRPHPSLLQSLAKELVEDELCRVVEFARLAVNCSEVMSQYEQVIDDYQIDMECIYDRISED